MRGFAGGFGNESFEYNQDDADQEQNVENNAFARHDGDDPRDERRPRCEEESDRGVGRESDESDAKVRHGAAVEIELAPENADRIDVARRLQHRDRGDRTHRGVGATARDNTGDYSCEGDDRRPLPRHSETPGRQQTAADVDGDADE